MKVTGETLVPLSAFVVVSAIIWGAATEYYKTEANASGLVEVAARQEETSRAIAGIRESLVRIEERLGTHKR